MISSPTIEQQSQNTNRTFDEPSTLIKYTQVYCNTYLAQLQDAYATVYINSYHENKKERFAFVIEQKKVLSNRENSWTH